MGQTDVEGVVTRVLIGTIPLHRVHRGENAISHTAQRASFGRTTVKCISGHAGGRVVDFQRHIGMSVEGVGAEREQVSVRKDFGDERGVRGEEVGDAGGQVGRRGSCRILRLESA